MRMKIHKKLFIGLILAILYGNIGSSQTNDTLQGIPKLRQLIKQKKVSEAKSELNQQIDQLKKQEHWDSLARYVEFVGSYALSQNNWEIALQKTTLFVEELAALNLPDVSKYAYKELAWVQDEAGRPDLSLKSLEIALEAAKKGDPNKPPKEEDMVYNMGYYASAKGDYLLAKKMYKKSLAYYKKEGAPDYVSYQQVYNALGGIMWMEGKMDSCNYYFQQSLEALKKTEDNPANRYYRPGLVRMNMAVVSNMLGRNDEAISFSEEAINNYNQFIKHSVDEQKINEAKASKAIAMENLAVFYNTIGEFTKAERLIDYTYQQKLKDKSNNDPSVIISKILLTQAKLNTRDMEGAQKLIEEVLQQLENHPGFDSYWRGTAYAAQAKIHEFFNKPKEAEIHYGLSEASYQKALGGGFNNDIISNFRDMALFYAKNNRPDKAIQIAQNIYKESQKEELKGSPVEWSYKLTLAETYFLLNDFKNAEKISKEILDLYPEINLEKATNTDAIVATLSMPQAIMLHTKSTLAQDPQPTNKTLDIALAQLQKALQILEFRNSFIKNYEDTQQLIAQNQDIIELAKSINSKLYQRTQKERYLDAIINLHESSVYNRIRARLNLRKNIQFSNMPKEILVQENKLREALSKSLEQNDAQSFQKFMDLNNEWDIFLQKLKKDYPNYFQMRYASLLSQPISYFENLPENTTWIRYLFIEKELYAIIINEEGKKLIPLPTKELSNTLEQLRQEQFDVLEISASLTKLYDLLWKPLEASLNTEKIVIFPDGPLYNLSFEMLTSQPIENFEDFNQYSLLNKYTFSYNFSLFLTQTAPEPAFFNKNFIGFAPSFTSEMKERYRMTIVDSSATDKTYLTLLPQPFSKELIENFEKSFNGKAFYNEKASKQVFLNNAKEYKIIHIGTHAESNNVNPELSRLVFAKQLDSTSSQDNYLYTYEIYNYDLSADLAVLTACETGKPGYQPGEGMISLAHAFTYAGSESILTSLWEIDEKSSAEIVGYFYKHLQEGLPKDEALKKAKQTYLSQAQGRSLAPQYWAGLVLMGDTTAIPISSSPSYLWWVGIALIALLLWFFLRKRF